MPTRKRTFYEVGWLKSGSPTTALSALRYVVEYGQACDVEGRQLSTPEYARFSGMATSHAYRRRDAFRASYPGNDELAVWEIFRPFLKASNFKAAGSFGQAIFCGSLIWNGKPKRAKA